MSIFAQFRTDPNKEQEGVAFDYGGFKVRLRREGNTNPKYVTAFQNALKPWRNRDIDKEPIEVRRHLNIDVFCKACYVEHSWETLVEGQYVRGIENESGEIVPGTAANVAAVLKLLPDLFLGLSREASNLDNFLASQTKEGEEALKDSSSGS